LAKCQGEKDAFFVEEITQIIGEVINFKNDRISKKKNPEFFTKAEGFLGRRSSRLEILTENSIRAFFIVKRCPEFFF